MKQKLLDTLKSARENLISRAENVPRDYKVTDKWSVKDVLSHVIGWDFHTMRAIEECLKGKRPFYFDEDWNTLNDEEVQKRRNLSLNDVITELKQSSRIFQDFVSTLPEERLTEYHGHKWRRYKITPESMISAAIEHDLFHAKKIGEATNH